MRTAERGHSLVAHSVEPPVQARILQLIHAVGRDLHAVQRGRRAGSRELFGFENMPAPSHARTHARARAHTHAHAEHAASVAPRQNTLRCGPFSCMLWAWQGKTGVLDAGARRQGGARGQRTLVSIRPLRWSAAQVPAFCSSTQTSHAALAGGMHRSRARSGTTRAAHRGSLRLDRGVDSVPQQVEHGVQNGRRLIGRAPGVGRPKKVLCYRATGLVPPLLLNSSFVSLFLGGRLRRPLDQIFTPK